MPYIKPRDVDFVKVQRTIKGYSILAPQLAQALDCSEPTARKKLNNPELFTLADIKKISRRLHIPLEELRAGIGW